MLGFLARRTDFARVRKVRRYSSHFGIQCLAPQISVMTRPAAIVFRQSNGEEFGGAVPSVAAVLIVVQLAANSRPGSSLETCATVRRHEEILERTACDLTGLFRHNPTWNARTPTRARGIEISSRVPVLLMRRHPCGFQARFLSFSADERMRQDAAEQGQKWPRSRSTARRFRSAITSA